MKTTTSTGYSASFIIHMIVLYGLFQMSTIKMELPSSRTIDLSLLQAPAPAIPQPQQPATPVKPPEPTPKQPEPVKPIPEPVKPKEIEVVKPQKKKILVTAPKPEPKPVIQEKTSDPPPVTQETEQTKEVDSAPPVSPPITATASPVSPAMTPSTKPQAGLSNNKELWKQEHFLAIKEAIQKHMKYPIVARKKGWQGKVMVSFVICDDGRIENVSVVESSGFSLLDKDALATIRNAAPFPKPPARIKIVVPVLYSLS